MSFTKQEKSLCVLEFAKTESSDTWRTNFKEAGCLYAAKKTELVQPYLLTLIKGRPVFFAGHKHISSLNLACQFTTERPSGGCFVNFVRNYVDHLSVTQF